LATGFISDPRTWTDGEVCGAEEEAWPTTKPKTHRLYHGNARLQIIGRLVETVTLPIEQCIEFASSGDVLRFVFRP
jgi:hypothetical protein